MQAAWVWLSQPSEALEMGEVEEVEEAASDDGNGMTLRPW